VRRRTGTIEPRKTGFRIRYTDLDGIRQSENYPTREAAEFNLAQRLAELAAGVPVSSRANTVTFKELAADVVNDYIVNNHRSLPDLKDRFRCHILPVLGRMKASRITTAQLKAYQVARLNEGAKPGTVNRETEVIRRTFRLAMQDRKIFSMPHVPQLKENNARQGFFTRDEVERLCRCLKSPLDTFVKFGFLTGWRLSEIQNLKWSNVDFVAGEIRLDPGTTKNGEPRVFPMSVELRKLLGDRQTKGMFPGTYVFMAHGRKVGQIFKAWHKACFDAGLPCVVGTDGKLVRSLRIFHDLRRSAAREMANRGIPQHIIQKLMGHKTASMFQRYAIVSDADLRSAVTLLDGAFVPDSVPSSRKSQ
jgi:integrase